MFAAARLLLLLTSLGGTTSLSLTGYGGAGYTGSAAAVSGVRTAKRAPAVYRAISTARLQQQTAAPPRVDRSEDGSSVRAPQYPYWYDPRIHNWGNIGAGGRFHATFAPLATAMIDQLSYGGFDVRKAVKQTLAANATVLDLCCGVGFSTAPGAVGIDTSPEMLSVAKLRRPDARFAFGNAESFGEDKSFDIVTLMFATHEMPADGRRRVLRNAMRVAKKSVVVVDIHPEFKETLRAKPLKGASFLSGEPYVLDYLAKIDSDIFSSVPAWGWTAKKETLLAEHVAVWRLERGGVWGI